MSVPFMLQSFTNRLHLRVMSEHYLQIAYTQCVQKVCKGTKKILYMQARARFFCENIHFMAPISLKIRKKSKKIAQLFAYLKKKQYFCSVNGLRGPRKGLLIV